MFNWLKAFWDRIKPGVKANLKGVIYNKLQPEITVFLTQNKEKIQKELDTASPQDIAKRACDFVADYLDRQL